jgi:hypothetical protein
MFSKGSRTDPNRRLSQLTWAGAGGGGGLICTVLEIANNGPFGLLWQELLNRVLLANFSCWSTVYHLYSNVSSQICMMSLDSILVDPCRLLSSLFLFGMFGLVWIDFSPPHTSPVITGLSELSGEPRFRNVNLRHDGSI